MAAFKKTDCPNCHRPVGLSDTRCRVCHHKLIWWYIIVAILVLVGLGCGIFLLEVIA